MKNIFLLLTALVLSGFTVNADTKNTSDDGIIERFGDEILEEVERLKLAAVELLGKGQAQ